MVRVFSLLSIDDVLLAEARHGDRDAVFVLGRALDVVGRIGRRAFDAASLIEDREEPVETDGGTVKGGKIEVTHGISS